MAIVQALLYSLLLGWGCAGLILALPLLLGRRGERYPQGLVPLALALGYAAGTARLLEIVWPAFPPVDATQWIFWLLIPALLVGSLQARRMLSPGLQIGLNLLTLVPAQLLLLSPLREGSGLSVWLLWGGGAGLLSTLLWFSQEGLSRREPLSPLLNGAWLSGVSGGLLMLGHSVILSQQALLLAGLLAAVAVLRLFIPATALAGSWSVPMLVLSLLWSGGRAYADLSPAVLLLIPALLAPWLAQTRLLQSQPAWSRWGLPLLISVVLAGLALAVVLLTQPAGGGYY